MSSGPSARHLGEALGAADRHRILVEAPERLFFADRTIATRRFLLGWIFRREAGRVLRNGSKVTR
jgi:hypothetical protein